MSIDLSSCRAHFPALKETVNGQPVAYFDGPGGTQVPDAVIEAVAGYYRHHNANTHGPFKNSRETEAIVDGARQAAAGFLGTPDPEEIAFGANMTTLNFALAQALARDLEAGDEIIITRLDHNANQAPWRSLAERGIVIREIPFDPATCGLDMDAYQELLSDKTRIVAAGWASNAVGTINPVADIVSLAHKAGAITVIDAVHYAPHGPIDVRDLGTDYLLCSPYKFFAPHLGILYGRRDQFESLRTYKVEPQLDSIPHKIETGTPNFEGIAGTGAAIDFIASLAGDEGDDAEAADNRRGRLVRAMNRIHQYEEQLFARLLDGLAGIDGVKTYGPAAGQPRTPTLSIRLDNVSPRDTAEALGDRGIFVWDGDFYAISVIDDLQLADSGGTVRIGLAPYNTAAEVDRLLNAVEDLAS